MGEVEGSRVRLDCLGSCMPTLVLTFIRTKGFQAEEWHDCKVSLVSSVGKDRKDE